MATITVTCAECGQAVEKSVGEYNRRVRLGCQRFYCGSRCSASASNRNSPRRPPPEAAAHLKADNRRDALSPFRWFLLRAKSRSRLKGPTDLSPDGLAALWVQQGGQCPLTGWPMVLPDCTTGFLNGRDPRNASLDRIDNEKGYVEGNVRFVAYMANVARCDFTDDQLREFCRAVAEST